MHSQLTGDNGLVLMAPDTPNGMEYSAGGTVAMELQTATWGIPSPMCIDRFGVSWLVDIAGVAR